MLSILTDTVFLIPARKGSKGFPFKNRKLFDETAKIIPKEFKKIVFVSTDDEEIQYKAQQYGFNVIKRPEILSSDTASVKDVIAHFINVSEIKNKKIILLYLTYPQRTWQDILDIYSFYLKNNSTSLVCCEQVKEHPCLMFFSKNTNKANPVIKHSFYRRQDYPKCVKLSLFLGIFNCEEVINLTDLLYNSNTTFFELQEEKIDVDFLTDYEKIK